MKILIADDHEVLRMGLSQILSEAYPNADFGQASTTSEVLKCLSQGSWDLLVLDIFMPGRSGLEVLSEANRLYPDLPVLVLSSAPEEQLAIRVLRAGASGYLNKQTAAEELINATSKILSGGKYISATLAERLAEQLSLPEKPLHERLSDREYSVLQLLVSGKSIKEIASDLSLSPKTISTFHIRIWEKLHVRNDIEMIRYAFAHGLVERGPQAAE
jgi:two-component system, NarL family, invasion response regulator UvrY